MENEVKKFLTVFEKEYLESAIEIIDQDRQNKFKFSMFAVAIREIIRIVLERLSSDDEITCCSWYKEYAFDKKAKITRKQRMAFAICGGLNIDELKKSLDIDIDEWVSPLRNKVDELSKYAHVTSTTYGIDFNAELEYNNVFEILLSFLRKIEQFRTEFRNRISYDVLERILQDFVTENPLDDIDIRATHFENPEFYLGDISVTNITSDLITLEIDGSIKVTHQIGSDYDVSVDQGQRWEQTYPCRCNVDVKVQRELSDLVVNLGYDDFVLEINTEYDEEEDYLNNVEEIEVDNLNKEMIEKSLKDLTSLF